MKKSPFLCILICVTLSLDAGSQGLYKIPFEEKVINSSLIVEGQVVSKYCFWNVGHTMIYTCNVIQIFKVFKGSTIKDTVEVVTPGGSLDGKIVQISHLPDFDLNDVGIFFCFASANDRLKPLRKGVFYEVYSGKQGFLKYDSYLKKASTPFARYDDIEEQLYSAIKKNTGQEYRIIKTRPPAETHRETNTLASNITSFSPSMVNAGTLLDPETNILTINGTGFGPASGMAAVLFDDPDDGTGGNFTTVAYNDPWIISWSSKSIQLRVPSKAGTGTFKVRDASGSIATSPSLLTVNYSVTSLGVTDPVSSLHYIKEINLYNSNGSGGYTTHYSTSTAGNGLDITASPALATFQRALTTWKEFVGFNVIEGSNTTAQEVTDDANNLIVFDNSNTGVSPLPAGVLASCYSYYAICPNNYAENQVMKTGFDIVIRNPGFSTGSTAFTLGPCPPNSSDYSQIDLESVLLHELGHAIGLEHVNDSYESIAAPIVGQINPGKLMNYAIINSTRRTSPDYSALAGALYLVTPQNNNYGLCGITEMMPLARIIESKDDCPVSFPSATLSQGTTVNFDLAHASSNKYVDPPFTRFRCDGLGGSQTNNAYYAFKTNNNTGSLQLTVSNYSTMPGNLTACSQQSGAIPVTGVRLALYEVNSCPSPDAYPNPMACTTITGNGTLAPIPGLAANSKYLMYVEGIENTKVSFNLLFGGVVLPLKLISFTGTSFNSYNEVQWKAETVKSVEKIVIQKSLDGVKFEDFGEVIEQNEFVNGRMRDPLPFPRTFYRLAIHNADNSIDLSNVVVLTRDARTYFTVYPNPASEFIIIQLNSVVEETCILKLYNSMGQLVKSEHLSSLGQTVKMQLGQLPTGMYQLELYKKDNTRLEAHKILIAQ